MRTRESGMPDEGIWSTFFDAPGALRQLGLTARGGDVVDFGCGYGTFAIPAAQVVAGLVHAIDIDPAMVEATATKARQMKLINLRTHVRDFLANGTGLADASVGYAMLFNILHAEEPLILLHEARRVLRPGGLLAVMHWNYDAGTPRGPSMAIRPKPEMLQGWAEQAGFMLHGSQRIDLPPFHYGIVFVR